MAKLNDELPFHEQLSCEILLTTNCNMSCTYCIARDLDKMVMDHDCGKSVVDMFLSLSEGAKEVEFTFTGGEPLLCLSSLKYLTCYADKKARSRGMNPSFILKTNGTILNTDIMGFLKLFNFRVVLSIDGLPDIHDNYRKANNGEPTHGTILINLEELIENEITCIASLTVHPKQAKNILSNIEYLYNLGVKNIDVGPVYGTMNWTNRNILDFSESIQGCAKFIRDVNEYDFIEMGPLYRNSEHVGGMLANSWGCKAGSTNIAFLPNGQITGCSALAMLIPRFPTLVLGDIRNGIDEPSVQDLFRYSQAQVENRPLCKNCEGAENCSGGCIAINLSVNNNPLSPPPFYCNTISSLSDAWQLAWGAKEAEIIIERVPESRSSNKAVAPNRRGRAVKKGC